MIREPIEQLINSPLVYTRGMNFPKPEEIRIYDSTLRDGEQTPGIAYTPEQKMEIVKQLSDIGVHIVDMGFPGVSESERQALRLIMQAKKRGEIREDFEIVVMCRSNQRDIDATIQVLDDLKLAPSEVTFFIFTSGSDLHVKYKLGKTLLKAGGRSEDEWLDTPVSWYREANLKLQCDAIRYARSQGVAQVEFGGEDGSRGDIPYITEIFNAGMKAGATRPSFSDTVGCLTPEATRQQIGYVVEHLEPKGTPLLVHFHNDYGLGTINTITALAAGAKAFCANVNGYGERAGNANLAEVVTALKFLYGVEIPGFKYEKLNELSRFVERMAGLPVQAHAPIVGMNVFSHESGIHTHGVLIDRRIYEAIPSEAVGGQQRFVYGKHSGGQVVEHGLRAHESDLRAAGVSLDNELIVRVTEEVNSLGLSEDDLVTIAISLAKSGAGAA